MDDSTIKKSAPKGTMGQTYLVSGKRVAMRLWQNEPPQAKESDELTLEGQTIKLQTGAFWVVSAQAEHSYRILAAFVTSATGLPALRSYLKPIALEQGTILHDTGAPISGVYSLSTQ
jgi:hypothetical protein